jgi:hypothetical protein
MDNEVYRTLTHHEARDLTASILRERGGRALVEHRLPSGKKADVIYVSPHYEVEIYEIKTELSASLVDNARHKYAHWCNRLWIVKPNATMQELELFTREGCWRSGREVIGLMGVVNAALYALRPAAEQRMLESLKRALLLCLNNP